MTTPTVANPAAPQVAERTGKKTWVRPVMIIVPITQRTAAQANTVDDGVGGNLLS